LEGDGWELSQHELDQEHLHDEGRIRECQDRVVWDDGDHWEIENRPSTKTSVVFWNAHGRRAKPNDPNIDFDLLFLTDHDQPESVNANHLDNGFLLLCWCHDVCEASGTGIATATATGNAGHAKENDENDGYPVLAR
jgi:hypothetical protein